MFKIGDRVMLTEESHQSCNVFREHPGDVATIIGIKKALTAGCYFYGLEFDRNIGGHDGRDFGNGKSGHCVIYNINTERAEKYLKRIQKNRKNNFY